MYAPIVEPEFQEYPHPQKTAKGYVPVSQSPYSEPQRQQRGHDIPAQWSSDLFDCMEDPFNCCFTCWFPCVTFGRIAEIVDEGSRSCAVSGGIYALLRLVGYALLGYHGLPCSTGFESYYSYMYRANMRDKFNLAGDPCEDRLVHCFCHSCALCQEYRELKHRGYYPALGWEENLQLQQHEMGTAMAAPANPTMEK